MIWLLLALAVYPPEITISGFSGDSVDLPLTIISDEKYQIIGDETLKVKKTANKIEAKIIATQPGIYENYVYVTPISKEPIITGTAVKVNTYVSTKSTQKLLSIKPKLISSFLFSHFFYLSYFFNN